MDGFRRAGGRALGAGGGCLEVGVEVGEWVGYGGNGQAEERGFVFGKKDGAGGVGVNNVCIRDGTDLGGKGC